MKSQYLGLSLLLTATAACSNGPDNPITPGRAAAGAGSGAAELLSSGYFARAVVPAGLSATPPKLANLQTRIEAALPDSVVRIGTRIVSRDFAAGDTVLYRYFKNDSLLLARRRVQPADTSQAPAPAYGGTPTYKGCAVIERGGRNSGVKSGSMCWVWAYTRPPLPPILDSVIRIARLLLLPAVDTVSARIAGQPAKAENRLQLCPFAVLTDGRKVKLHNAWNRPACEAAYRRWLAEIAV